MVAPREISLRHDLRLVVANTCTLAEESKRIARPVVLKKLVVTEFEACFALYKGEDKPSVDWPWHLYIQLRYTTWTVSNSNICSSLG